MNKEDREKRLCQSDPRISSPKEHQRLLRRLQKSADDYILWYEVQRFEAEYAKRHKGDPGSEGAKGEFNNLIANN